MHRRPACGERWLMMSTRIAWVLALIAAGLCPAAMGQTTFQPARQASTEVQAAPTPWPRSLPQPWRLSSSDFQTRQAAQADLTALSQAALVNLVAQTNTEDPEQRLRSAQVLDQLALAVTRSQMLLRLPPPQREAFEKAAQAQPGPVRQAGQPGGHRGRRGAGCVSQRVSRPTGCPAHLGHKPSLHPGPPGGGDTMPDQYRAGRQRFERCHLQPGDGLGQPENRATWFRLRQVAVPDHGPRG